MKNVKTIVFGALIAAMILPFSMMDVSAQSATETKYSKNYIERMFVQLEPLMIKHDNGHLSLNATLANEYGLSPYDTAFADNWIGFNNNLIDAHNSGEGVDEALTPLTDGIFSNVFNDPVFRNSYFSSTACGDHNFQDPHPVYREFVKSNLSKPAKTSMLLEQGYHAILITLNPSNEFAKLSTHAEVCNNGPLRDQVTLKSKGYSWQPLEPNPETLTYSAPTYWWNAYTAWWHTLYNDNLTPIPTAPTTITKPL